MGFLSALGIKGIAIIAMVLALVGWGGYKTYQVNKAQSDLATAIAQRDEAGLARDKAIDANKVSAAAIQALEKEKADVQKSLNNLDADRKKNAKTISDLTAAIEAQKNNPANKVTLSPVLKLTIDTIQKQRAAKVAP